MSVTPAERLEELHHEHYYRILPYVFDMPGSSWDFTPDADEVYLVPVQVYRTVTLSHLGFVRGSGAAGGAQVMMGVYADNGDTPVGGALLGSTAAVAVIAGINQKQEIALAAALQLTPGLYWYAIVEDTGGANLFNWASDCLVHGAVTLDAYHYAAGALTLIDPCPAVAGEDPVVMFGLVSSIP